MQIKVIDEEKRVLEIYEDDEVSCQDLEDQQELTDTDAAMLTPATPKIQVGLQMQ